MRLAGSALDDAPGGVGRLGGEFVSGNFTFRPFESIEDFRECVALQEATWGIGFSERVSLAILKVSQMLGGVAAGAYAADGELAGFVFGLTGLRKGELAHWSDMLAVRPDVRDAGLGRRLKAYQRQEVLRSGVETMYWTFDPLQSRNAHLNITRLGAVVREYVENMYGESDSPLHMGIGTDRFIALWLLNSPRVEARIATAAHELTGLPDAPSAVSADCSGPHPRPLPADVLPRNDRVRISIPADVSSLMQYDLGLAVEWRETTRAAFAHYLTQGYEVRDFERGEYTSTYLLARIDEEHIQDEQ
jgi:predicted GNAT superfamily acetyltransferase